MRLPSFSLNADLFVLAGLLSAGMFLTVPITWAEESREPRKLQWPVGFYPSRSVYRCQEHGLVFTHHPSYQNHLLTSHQTVTIYQVPSSAPSQVQIVIIQTVTPVCPSQPAPSCESPQRRPCGSGWIWSNAGR